MAESLQGLDTLLKTLAAIKDRTAKRAGKAGVNAGLTVLVRNARAAINASSASPEMKRAAREAIAKRIKKKEGQELVGKVGFGVGKATKARRGKIAKRSMDKTKKGVGISSANIHWPVLGTRERTLFAPVRVEFEGFTALRKLSSAEYAARKLASGEYYRTVWETGRMEPVLENLLPAVVHGAGPQMLEAMRKKISEILAREAAKKGG